MYTQSVDADVTADTAPANIETDGIVSYALFEFILEYSSRGRFTVNVKRASK